MLEYCRKTENILKDAGLRVYFDDRDIRAGKKFYEWEMRGVPLRLEIGPRDIKNKKMVVLQRNTLQKNILDYEEDTLIETINSLLKDVSKEMADKAWEKLEENIKLVNTVEEAEVQLTGKRGIIKFSWCGKTSCGKDLEEKLRVDLLGIRSEDKEECMCINCEEKAEKTALLAKTY